MWELVTQECIWRVHGWKVVMNTVAEDRMWWIGLTSTAASTGNSTGLLQDTVISVLEFSIDACVNETCYENLLNALSIFTEPKYFHSGQNLKYSADPTNNVKKLNFESRFSPTTSHIILGTLTCYSKYYAYLYRARMRNNLGTFSGIDTVEKNTSLLLTLSVPHFRSFEGLYAPVASRNDGHSYFTNW
jgi:hypothetical protein